VRKRASTLIDEIEKEALDASIPVSSPLRKLVALGGQAGSRDLLEWAGRALRGQRPGHLPGAATIKALSISRVSGELGDSPGPGCTRGLTAHTVTGHTDNPSGGSVYASPGGSDYANRTVTSTVHRKASW
jgi:hypothetical protein